MLTSDSTQIKSSQKRGIKRRPVADDVDSDSESEASFTFLSDDEEKENRDQVCASRPGVISSWFVI